MACDRIERVLQAFFRTQEEARPAGDVALHSWRVLAHFEDVDGQVEGLFADIFHLGGKLSVLPTGKRLGSHVTCASSF